MALATSPQDLERSLGALAYKTYAGLRPRIQTWNKVGSRLSVSGSHAMTTARRYAVLAGKSWPPSSPS